MSAVYLHLGQCGNQLGQAFWEEASTSKWAAAGVCCNSNPAQGDGKRVALTSSDPVVASNSGTLQPGTGTGREGVVPSTLENAII